MPRGRKPSIANASRLSKALKLKAKPVKRGKPLDEITEAAPEIPVVVENTEVVEVLQAISRNQQDMTIILGRIAEALEARPVAVEKAPRKPRAEATPETPAPVAVPEKKAPVVTNFAIDMAKAKAEKTAKEAAAAAEPMDPFTAMRAAAIALCEADTANGRARLTAILNEVAGVGNLTGVADEKRADVTAALLAEVAGG